MGADERQRTAGALVRLPRERFSPLAGKRPWGAAPHPAFATWQLGRVKSTLPSSRERGGAAVRQGLSRHKT